MRQCRKLSFDLKMLRSAAAALALAALGCEPPPPAPPRTTAPASQPAPPPVLRRPTTQTLLAGPWKSVPISILPLNIRVPESWEMLTIGESGLLAMEGFAPSGLVQLRCAARRRIPVDQLQNFVTAAKADAARKSGKLKQVELREGTNFSILETLISAEKPDEMPGTDDQGNFAIRVATPLKWSRLIFMKSNENNREYDCYDLSFGDLSLEQYERDRDFLQKILDSLAYDPSRKQ